MMPTATKVDYPEKDNALSDYEPKVEGIYTTGVRHSVPAQFTASGA
jgi:acetylxylan esterase